MAEPPATSQQIVGAARAFAAMLAAKVSDEERDAALRTLEESVAILSEALEEFCTVFLRETR
jgi:hypothetical protein